MNNMYYGLSKNLFDKHELKETNSFLSTDHAQMLSRLEYLKDVRGIAIFTAAPRMGKSFALRCFEHPLNKNLYTMKYICLSTISVSEFYKQFCDVLGIEAKGSKTAMFQNIQERLYYLFKEKRQPFLLAIDEAQYLKQAVLKDLKMLMNFSYDSLNCFSLILSGEPYLNHTLQKQSHEALRQRITVHYAFQGMQGDEISAYIHHKLSLAGGSPSMIGVDAIHALAGYSNGNPRIIDNVMTTALLLGEQQQKPSIDSEIMLSAINEQSLVYIHKIMDINKTTTMCRLDWSYYVV